MNGVAMDDEWSLDRGRIAMERDHSIHFVQAWSTIGAVTVSGDQVTKDRWRAKKGLPRQ